MACERDPKRFLINDWGKDLISDLPSNVIDDIMDRLPLQEAAKLCILSRKWKHIWMSYPNLRLDAQFFRVVLSNKLFPCYELNRILSNILLSHNGSIPKFFLTIPKMDCLAPHNVHITKLVSGLPSSNIRYMSSPEISPLVAHLSQNGIREISLDNHGSSRLKLPSQLFSCVELEKLKLCRFEVHIPHTFESFKSITRLEFESVTLTGRTLENFISSCLSLEILAVKGIRDGGSLIINAPNLKLIELEGTFTSVCLKGCLDLSSVTIGYKEKPEKILNKHYENASGLVTFLSRSCKLEELNLRHNFCEFMGVPGVWAMLRCPFDHLRKLQLTNIPSEGTVVVSCVFRIIYLCPNLEELKISFMMDHGTTGNPSNVFQRLNTLRKSTTKVVGKPTWAPSEAFQQLRTVYLMTPTCSNNELHFIKFLLANAPILEKLYIPSNVDRMPTLASKLTKHLLRFSRASSKAEIVYLDHLP